MTSDVVVARRAARLRREKRDETGLRLYALGLTYRQIAEFKFEGGQLYSDSGCAHRAITKLIEAPRKRTTEFSREAMLIKLDNILNILGPAIQKGDDKKINTALKTMDMQARLMGLYEPIKLDGMNGGTVVVQFSEKLANPGAMQAATMEIEGL